MQDYNEICTNLENLSPNASKKFKIKFSIAITNLKLNPYMYQCYDKQINDTVRRIIINKYIIFYRVLHIYRVNILRIIPQKFNYSSHLEEYKILNQIPKKEG